MNESPAHDAHVLDDLIARVEHSLSALQTGAGLPSVVRDQAIARRSAVDELRAAAGSPEAAAAGDGLLEKAQRALGRFVGDTSDAPADAADRGAGLDELEAEEAALQSRFETALADDRLSGPVRDVVLRAYDKVKPGRDAVRQAALSARGEA